MAQKFTAAEVAAILKKAVNPKSYDFILEIVHRTPIAKQPFSLRLKGKNGEIVFPQESNAKKQSVERLAARLLNGGLKAKVKYVNINESPAKSTKPAKPVKYPKGGE